MTYSDGTRLAPGQNTQNLICFQRLDCRWPTSAVSSLGSVAVSLLFLSLTVDKSSQFG